MMQIDYYELLEIRKAEAAGHKAPNRDHEAVRKDIHQQMDEFFGRGGQKQDIPYGVRTNSVEKLKQDFKEPNANQGRTI